MYNVTSFKHHHKYLVSQPFLQVNGHIVSRRALSGCDLLQQITLNGLRLLSFIHNCVKGAAFYEAKHLLFAINKLKSKLNSKYWLLLLNKLLSFLEESGPFSGAENKYKFAFTFVSTTEPNM